MRSFKVLAIILTIYFQYSNTNNINIRSQHMSLQEQHILRCIQNITSKYFSKTKAVAILTTQIWSITFPILTKIFAENQLDRMLLQLLHSDSLISYLVTGYDLHPGYSPEPVVKPESVILLLGDSYLTEQIRLLEGIMNRITYDQWNARARFIIVLMGNRRIGSEQVLYVREVLHFMSSWNVYNVVVLTYKDMDETWESTDNCIIDVYSSVPFHPENKCGQLANKVTLVDKWMSSANGFLYNADLYPSKESNDWGGCIVRTSLNFKEPYVTASIPTQYYVEGKIINSEQFTEGLEVKIIETVANVTNFKVHYFYQNDAFEKNISYKSLDVAGPYWIYPLINVYYDTTFPHFLDEISWFVGPGMNRPRWHSFFLSFQPGLWIAVLVTYIVTSFVFWLIQVAESESEHSLSQHINGVIFSYILTLLMNTGGGTLQKYKTIISKGFLVIWLLYCMQINTAYQSNLIGVLVNPGVYPQISNLKELDDSGFELISLLFDRGNSSYVSDMQAYFRQPIKNCNLSTCHSYIIRMARDSDVSMFCSKFNLLFTEAASINAGEKSLFSALDDASHLMHMGLILTSGSLLLSRMDTVFFRLQSSGIIDKWWQDIQREHFMLQFIDEEVFALTFSHIQGAFYILGVGLSIGCFVFIIEIINYIVMDKIF